MACLNCLVSVQILIHCAGRLFRDFFLLFTLTTRKFGIMSTTRKSQQNENTVKKKANQDRLMTSMHQKIGVP